GDIRVPFIVGILCPGQAVPAGGHFPPEPLEMIDARRAGFKGGWSSRCHCRVVHTVLFLMLLLSLNPAELGKRGSWYEVPPVIVGAGRAVYSAHCNGRGNGLLLSSRWITLRRLPPVERAEECRSRGRISM